MTQLQTVSFYCKLTESNQTETTLGSGFDGNNFESKFASSKEKFTTWNI